MTDVDSPKAAGPNGTAAAQKSDGEERWFDRFLSALGFRPTEGIRENLTQALAADDGVDGVFGPEERRLIQNILELRDMRIADVMVPRADIEAVPETIALGELLKTFKQAGHSRLPVYRESLDDPIGFVHAKDVMIAMAAEAAGDDGLDFGQVDLKRPLTSLTILRPVLFVPPSMAIMDLMLRMQANRTQLALVVDEYGGTDGLVSLEDLVETVVGDIEDEYDWPDDPTMRPEGDDVWASDARVSVEDFEREAGVRFPSVELLEDVDTVGGVVFAIRGRMPVRGDVVTSDALPGFVFEVLDADPRRIKSVRVTVVRAELGGRAVPELSGK